MSEILFENKNATVKKISKETENGAKEISKLQFLSKSQKKKNRKTIINKSSELNI